MVKNDNGEKVSAKKLVQDMFAETVKASGDAFLDNLEQTGTEKGFTNREKDVVKDQVAKLTKRLMRVLTPKVAESDEAEAE